MNAQGTMFDLTTAGGTATAGACPHPQDARILTRNLFAPSEHDLTCTECGAIIAPAFLRDDVPALAPVVPFAPAPTPPFLRKDGEVSPGSAIASESNGGARASLRLMKMGESSPLASRNRNLPPRHVAHDRRKAMTRSEFDAMRKAIRAGTGRNPLRDELLVTMIWNHALRVREAVSITWDDVMFAEAEILVRRVKGGRNLRQRINGDELRALRRLQREQHDRHQSRFVFVSERGTPLSHDTARDIVMQAAAAAGLPIRNPHALRHGRAIEAAEAEHHPTHVISALLGHRDLRTTTTYLQELGIVVPAARG